MSPSGAAARQSTIASTRPQHRLGAYYFCCLGALGSVLPFASLFFAERGIPPSRIGWVLFLLPVSNIAVPPIWGLLADRLRARVSLLRWASFSCVPATLLFAPDWGLAGVLVAMAAFSLARAPLIPLADAVAHGCLGHDRARFSLVRAWGSVGFAVCALLAGQLETSREPVLFATGAATLYLLAALCTVGLAGGEVGAARGQRRARVLQRALRHVRRSGLVLLLVGNVFYYCGHSMFDVYFGLHARALGTSDAFIGTAWGVAVTAEVALMFRAPPYMARFRASSLLVVAALTSALRWSLLSGITSTGWILAIQPLHAVTFGLWYLAMVKLVQERTDDRLRASVQAFAMAAMGAGMGAGFLLGGSLFEQGGGHGMFVAATLTALCAAALYAGLLRAPRARGRNGAAGAMARPPRRYAPGRASGSS